MDRKFSYIEEMIKSGYTIDALNDYEKFVYPYIACNILGLNKSSKILDAGAGSGRILCSLKLAGFEKLYAIDLEEKMKDTFSEIGVEFRVADLEKDKLEFPSNFFEAIIAKNVIEHLNDYENMMREFYRILKKRGYLVLITDDWRKTYKIFWRDPTHKHPYDKEAIERLLRIYKYKIVWSSSFLTKYGIGKLKLYRLIHKLAFIGNFILVIGKKQ